MKRGTVTVNVSKEFIGQRLVLNHTHTGVGKWDWSKEGKEKTNSPKQVPNSEQEMRKTDDWS